MESNLKLNRGFCAFTNEIQNGKQAFLHSVLLLLEILRRLISESL